MARALLCSVVSRCTALRCCCDVLCCGVVCGVSSYVLQLCRDVGCPVLCALCVCCVVLCCVDTPTPTHTHKYAQEGEFSLRSRIRSVPLLIELCVQTGLRLTQHTLNRCTHIHTSFKTTLQHRTAQQHSINNGTQSETTQHNSTPHRTHRKTHTHRNKQHKYTFTCA